MLLYEFRYCRLRGANSGQGAYTLMSCDPIGVFDSGLGGLTAVKELLHVLPNEDIVYSAIRAGCPTATEAGRPS